MKNINVKNIFNNEIMPLLNMGKYDLAEKKLKMMYLQNYSSLNDLEDKRLIAYNLSWLLAKQGRNEEAKHYLLDLKNEIEQDKIYIEEYENKYCNLLMLYLEVDQDITKEEYYNTCKMLNDYYKKIHSKEQELITSYNLAVAEGNTDEINKILIYIKENENLEFAKKEILSKINNNKGEKDYEKENYNCCKKR